MGRVGRDRGSPAPSSALAAALVLLCAGEALSQSSPASEGPPAPAAPDELAEVEQILGRRIELLRPSEGRRFRAPMTAIRGDVFF